MNRCSRGLSDGSIYAGQSAEAFLAQVAAIQTFERGGLTTYHFPVLEGYEGIAVTTKDGRLVRAVRWTDYAPPHVYFDVVADADRASVEGVPSTATTRPSTLRQPVSAP
jgi:hypothetical protein